MNRLDYSQFVNIMKGAAEQEVAACCEAMHVISQRKLREFWAEHARAEEPLRSWYRVASEARWQNPNEVKQTYNTVDCVGRKVVFDVGGNKYRLIAVIDYERHKLFIRFVLTHEEYDKGQWKKDSFGEDWKGGEAPPAQQKTQRQDKKRRPRRRR
jgi:mRNA interferase HigB